MKLNSCPLIKFVAGGDVDSRTPLWFALLQMPTLNSAYRRYFSGIKKADCLLAAKTRNSHFMRIILEPAVPRRRPDLTSFLHKPLEHYRDILKLLQTILNNAKVIDDEYPALAKVVQEMQV
ncbi:unnamed protein product [Timema podura]|uniref:DH domain-containing protein n=1 Tax=Timema podura TaxID=61482 RepID=A0ABN7PUF4_TIMPD|nr:unnamed protein product [Timema podura]